MWYHALRTLSDTFSSREALNAVLRVPGQARLAVHARQQNLAVDQYQWQQKSCWPFSDLLCLSHVAGLLWGGCSPAGRCAYELAPGSQHAAPPDGGGLGGFSAAGRSGVNFDCDTAWVAPGLAELSIDEGTFMQVSPVAVSRQMAHAQVIKEALGFTDPAIPLLEGQPPSLQCVFMRLLGLCRILCMRCQ